MICLAVIDHRGTTFTKGGTKFNSEYCPRVENIHQGGHEKGGTP